MPPKKKNDKTVPVEAIRHKDKRKNIPTGELRRYVKKAEEDYPVTLYPRNPDLDPQLVWKGKDQQDSKPLEIPAVPVYIQEKIHPRVIVENIKRQAKKTKDQMEFDLFSDFNGLPDFEAKIDFYHHEANWTNRMVLGDSLLVMNSLAEKEGLKGQVQSIFLDPPYGIRFGSNWQVSTRNRNVKDGKEEGLAREPEQVRAFRDTWSMGIHSYLEYLRARLLVVRSLLADTGSVFVQIGDENVHLVRSLMDEVFGNANFCSQINFRSMQPLSSDGLDNVYDYILWYAKDIEHRKFRPRYLKKPLEESGEYRYIDDPKSPNGFRQSTPEELGEIYKTPEKHPIFRRSDFVSSGYTPSCIYDLSIGNKTITPRGGKSWRTHKDGAEQLKSVQRLFVIGESIYYKLYYSDFPYVREINSWNDTMGGFSETKSYVVQTSPSVIERCLLMTTDPGDIVLDPTCGSGTTAYVAEQWGRRWITIDTSRVALALARTRLMSARYPYYYLSDSADGLQKEAEITGKVPPSYPTQNDIRKGFVYKRAPHITLKSIANNPDIKSGMSRLEIDAAILRHADQEYLFDQPYEDPKRVRVCGPFTVESLSPHRILGIEDTPKDPDSAIASTREAADFNSQILENLRKSGIQNTKKHERLEFTLLDPHAGTWIHALGRQEIKGTEKLVALSIGPKYGTITPEHIREASKEAGRIKIRGQEVDLVVILGFAFGPHVYEEVKQHGDMTILIVRMNPDLMMADELLKKTASANLFMVFGEPDVEIKQLKSGKYQVSIRGVDIYDPTTGEIRSSSKDDIACWFIDTDYDEESFFVRHAYFLGNNEPYDKLKRALRAEVDEAAWSSLYSDTSQPFDAPETGKIAVKVINHYGDEVMRVFEVN